MGGTQTSHLGIHNSAVSLETSANRYGINVVRANETSAVPLKPINRPYGDPVVSANATSALPDGFERLENNECIHQYGRLFVSDRSDLWLVVSPDTVNVNYVRTLTSPESFDSSRGRMCTGMADSCSVESLKAHP